MAKQIKIEVVREGKGQWAVVDWNIKPWSTAAANTIELHPTKLKAEQAAQKERERQIEEEFLNLPLYMQDYSFLANKNKKEQWIDWKSFDWVAFACLLLIIFFCYELYMFIYTIFEIDSLMNIKYGVQNGGKN